MQLMILGRCDVILCSIWDCYWQIILCFCVTKTNLMHYLSSVYFVNQPLHVSGIFVNHHQEVLYIYIYIYIYTHTTTGTCCAFQLTVFWPGWNNRQSTEKHKTYQLLYICSKPSDDGLQICPKRVEVDWRNKLKINSASSWFLRVLHSCIEMNGQQDITLYVSQTRHRTKYNYFSRLRYLRTPKKSIFLLILNERLSLRN